MATRPTIAVFLRHLARLVRVGAPLDEGLAALAAAAPERGVRRAATAIRAGIAAGRPLHECLAAHSRWFPPAVVAAVEQGERGGTLAEALAATAAHADVLARVRRSSRVDLAYVGVVLGVFVFAIVLRASFFGAAFDRPSGGEEWASFGTWLTQWLWPTLVALLLLLAALYRVFAHRHGPWGLDALVLRVPWFGPTVRLELLAPFLHHLGLLLGRGADERLALDESLPLLRNTTLHAAGEAARHAVGGGTPLRDALSATDLLSAVERGLLDGHASDTDLPDGLCRLARDLVARGEARTRLSHLAAGPLLILMVGGAIGWTLYEWVMRIAG